MSSCIKAHMFFSGMLLNHLITSLVFFHWLRINVSLIFLFIFSKMCLLTLPSSDFVGFNRRHDGLDWKFSLWSFNVIKAGHFARHSVRSHISRLLAICFASRLMDCSSFGGAFLYVFVT